jgi:signal transduction histidine kinase/ligand-binding sensor domain-containing protein/DNA-binding response OmpR family regulator
VGNLFYLDKRTLFKPARDKSVRHKPFVKKHVNAFTIVLTLFCSVACGVIDCLALPKENDVDSKFRFEHLTVNDGLAHSDAMTVVQDCQGFVWVGTNNGINRYDGYELRKYELPVNNKLGRPGNRIRILYSDTKGRLWAGTEGTGLYLYERDKDAFVSVSAMSFNRELGEKMALLMRTTVTCVTSSEDGRLWVGTQDYGVFCLKFGAGNQVSKVSRILLTNPDGANYAAGSLCADERERIWIGTMGSGLWICNTKFMQTNNDFVQAKEVSNFPERFILNLYRDKKGDFWVSSDAKVYRAGKADFDKNPLPRFMVLPYIFNGIQCVYRDSFQRFWVGTNFGLLMIRDPEAYMLKPSAGLIQLFVPQDTDPNSINSGRIHQMTEDSFGNLWLAASSGGLNKVHLRSKPFHHLYRQLSENPSLPNSYVNAIAKDEEKGQLWIGTRNGFSVYDDGTKSYQNYLSLRSAGNVTGVDVSSFLFTKNLIWVGTRYNGIYVVRRNGPMVLQRLPALPGANPWYYISPESMIQDTRGQVWVATFGKGIHVFDAEGRYLRSFNKSNGSLPTDDLTFLLYDAEKDMIWLSTRDEGLLKLKEKEGRLLVTGQYKHDSKKEQRLKLNFVWPLLKDLKGTIWIGTIGGGLHQLRAENGRDLVTCYDKLMIGQDIESILSDNQGNLWMGGSGLNKFSPAHGKVFHFDVSDGLQSNAFKVGAAYKAKDGTMYFGGTNGVTFFRPEDILSNPSPPIVRITRLRVLHKKTEDDGGLAGSAMAVRLFSEKEGVVIQADENDFSFEFVGLNYVNPQKQTYAFMLEGYNRDWVHLPVGQRVAGFANLPAGTYVFKVRANNGEGQWSVNPVSVKVTILPPWWKTWWAYLAYTALIAGAFFLYRRAATNRRKLKNSIEIERLRSEKEKELSELKSQFFTSVSHEFRTPLTLIMDPMEEFMTSLTVSETMREKVTMMHKQTRKLLNLVNQLLSFRKLESGHSSLEIGYYDATVFIREIFVIFKLKAEQYKLEYTSDLPEQEVMLWFDAEKLEIVITNLLSNAFKYTSPKGKVHLSVKVRGSAMAGAKWENGELCENYLEITVRDSGSGIQPHELSQIFDPYYQAANARGTVGTGIGLALVAELVKKHSGEVSVQSVYGEYACFTVKLPFGDAHFLQSDRYERDVLRLHHEEVGIEADLLETANGSGPTQDVKILIVEDNDDLRVYLKALFDSEFQVVVATNGLDALKKVLELQPDLIISDINMPGMNGLELCKKIKQNLKTLHIPVILLTARAAAVQELEGLQTGADDYIPKPFNSKILKAKVNNLLRSRDKLHQYYQRQLLLQPTDIDIPDEDRLFLENAMKIVEDNLMDSEFNVQALVSRMHMSQSVFYRRIKNVTGQSAIEFIKDVRLKRAAQLLSGQQTRISEVAFMVGIEDPKNFRVSFQKLFNMTPSQYVKMHRSSQVQ